MSWAAVIVLHRSRAELARLLPTLDAPQLVVVDVGPDDGGRRPRACGRRARHRAPRQPRLRRGEQPRARARHPAGRGAPEPGHDRSSPRRCRNSRAGPAGPASTHPACSTRTAACSAARTRSRARSAPSCPRRCPGCRAPSESGRSRTARHTPRTVGWAIAACLAAPTHLIRFDERLHLFAEDMDLCLQARARGLRTFLHTDLDAHPHRRPQHRGRTVRPARAQPPRRDRAPAGAASGHGGTTPPRSSRSPPERGRAAASVNSSGRPLNDETRARPGFRDD